jgi:hypothetical protein
MANISGLALSIMLLWKSTGSGKMKSKGFSTVLMAWPLA